MDYDTFLGLMSLYLGHTAADASVADRYEQVPVVNTSTYTAVEY